MVDAIPVDTLTVMRTGAYSADSAASFNAANRSRSTAAAAGPLRATSNGLAPARPSFKPSQKRNVTLACGLAGCSYVALSAKHLTRHRKSHDGDRPYVCTHPDCGHRSKQMEHLKTHMLKHSDLRPFICTICDFATKRKEHLKRHVQRHGKEFLSDTV